MYYNNNLVPALFIIVMQLAVEDILKHLKRKRIIILLIKYNSNKSKVLKLQIRNKATRLIAKELNILICINDSTILFNARDNLIKGYEISYIIIVKYNSIQGYKNKMLITKAIYFPITSKLKE